MRQLITAILTGLILITGLVIVSIPASRDVIPSIRNYFSIQTGIWQNARNVGYPSDILLQTRGLDDDIIIRRGKDGVPHIKASTKRDAAFGLGYVTAYDRYFQMRINSRTVEGKLAEWLGESYINTDKAFLNLNLDAAAWKALGNLNDTDYNYVGSYSNGVNLFINQHFNVLKPIEFKMLNLGNNYWRPVDGMRVATLLGYYLTYSEDGIYHQQVIDDKGEQFFRDFYMRNFPGDDLLHGQQNSFTRIANQQLQSREVDISPALEHMESQRAHRNRIPAGRSSSLTMKSILLDKSRSERNQPIFAVDFQSQATIPSQWYEVHIHLPERSIYGITMPGLPGLIAAYNGQTAWAISKTSVDQLDFVHLEVTPDHKQYKLGDSWVNFKETTHTINSREGRSVRHQTLNSEFGPVLYIDNYGIAMQWNMMHNSINPANLWDLLDTHNIDGINALASNWSWPVVLLQSADREGQIATRLAGRQPVRKNAIGVQRGISQQMIWNSFISGNDLPMVSNPENGSIINTGQNPSTENYNNYLGYNWPKTWQNETIEKILSQKQRHNADNISQIFLDVELPYRFMISLLNEQSSELSSRNMRELIANINQWDFKADLNSDIPILFDNFLRIFRNKIFRDVHPSARPSDRSWSYYLKNNPNHSFFNLPKTPRVETGRDILLEALTEAYEITLIEYGTRSNWLWSSANRLRISHTSDSPGYRVLDYGNVSRPGFNGTVNAATSRNSTTASTLRMVIDFGSSDQAVRVNHLGAVSEDPLGNYYDLQLNRWLNGMYKVRNIRPIDQNQSISTVTIRSTER